MPEGLRGGHHVLEEGSVETPVKACLRTAFLAALDALPLLLSSIFGIFVGRDAFSADCPGPHVIDKGLGMFFKDDDVGVHRPVRLQCGDGKGSGEWRAGLQGHHVLRLFKDLRGAGLAVRQVGIDEVRVEDDMGREDVRHAEGVRLGAGMRSEGEEQRCCEDG